MPRYDLLRIDSTRPFQQKPDWLKVRPPSGESFVQLKNLFHNLSLHTVCEEAHCPNITECWGGGTATLMLMGDTCTRGCRFCNVKTGNPMMILDEDEPRKVAEAIGKLGLTYIVLTSVDRDDLPDGGAGHFAKTISAIKSSEPTVIVEALIPDFRGDPSAIRKLVEARPEVIDHNLETVRRLTPSVRDPRAGYDQSLEVLQLIKTLDKSIFTKSSLMLGLGETEGEILTAMDDLRKNGVDILTLGQYLQPSRGHIAVKEYVTPERFEYYKKVGEHKGFTYVASGPLVRSSYRAGEFFMESHLGRKTTNKDLT